ncbi:MAG: RNA polymerase sigma factor RpoE [Methylococcales bacterium]|jgi:RNA polymerase sigma-70 factor (ECF subfamily)|nr:RNA polymerase sigma factor RpoE [Methylococcales bacterium]
MGQSAIDLDLVNRTLQGDKKAFDLLVQKYQQKIINLIMRYVKDFNDACDVAQEAFINAYRALSKFRQDSAFYTWLYRIAVNTAKNFLSSRNRRKEVDILDDDSEDSYSEHLLKDTATPENYSLRDEIAETVNSAINRLPEELKTTLVLREIDGLSYEEIANVLECPIGTVRSRIFRAREAVDKVLKPLLENVSYKV